MLLPEHPPAETKASEQLNKLVYHPAERRKESGEGTAGKTNAAQHSTGGRQLSRPTNRCIGDPQRCSRGFGPNRTVTTARITARVKGFRVS